MIPLFLFDAPFWIDEIAGLESVLAFDQTGTLIGMQGQHLRGDLRGVIKAAADNVADRAAMSGSYAMQPHTKAWAEQLSASMQMGGRSARPGAIHTRETEEEMTSIASFSGLHFLVLLSRTMSDAITISANISGRHQMQPGAVILDEMSSTLFFGGGHRPLKASEADEHAGWQVSFSGRSFELLKLARQDETIVVAAGFSGQSKKTPGTSAQDNLRSSVQMGGRHVPFASIGGEGGPGGGGGIARETCSSTSAMSGRHRPGRFERSQTESVSSLAEMSGRSRNASRCTTRYVDRQTTAGSTRTTT